MKLSQLFKYVHLICLSCVYIESRVVVHVPKYNHISKTQFIFKNSFVKPLCNVLSTFTTNKTKLKQFSTNTITLDSIIINPSPDTLGRRFLLLNFSPIINTNATASKLRF